MKKIIIAIVCFFMLSCNVSYAMTDNAGVLAGLENNNNLYNYLNMYHYRLWKADHRFSKHDMYISQDDSVIVSLFNDKLGAIYILKPGYKTNKGIEVGMNTNDMKYAYGGIYDSMDSSLDYKQGGCIDGYGDGNYTGYYAVEYVSEKNEGLTFIIDRYVDRIVLIRYQENRHGNTHALGDVKSYNLLPYKR